MVPFRRLLLGSSSSLISWRSLNLVQIVNRCINNSAGSSQVINQYDVVQPNYPVSYPKRYFPENISKPNYAHHGYPDKHTNNDAIKTVEEIKKIWHSCQIAKNILMTTGKELKVGMTCEDIDELVYQLCLKHKCYPSPLNYSNYPKCVTTSVNNIAVHAIPDQRPLQKGDVISIDVSIFYDGFHGDCCHTFTIEPSDMQTKHLINVSELCLYEAINICKAGERLSLIGQTIEKVANEYEMGVIRQFCGHGVGRNLHENPRILHYDHDSDELMQENMVFTIEPIISESTDTSIVTYDDHWTVGTENFARTAQFEHTIWIQNDKAVILTHYDE